MSPVFKGFIVFILFWVVISLGVYFGYTSQEEIPTPADSIELPDTVAEITSILAGDRSIAENPHFSQIAQKIHGTAYWFEDVDPFMVARLVYVESRGDSLAVSHKNAVGLGQVRPSVWLGAFPQCGNDLRRVRDNICYTVHILDYYQKTSPTQEMALLSYNGCKSSHCHWYAGTVMADVQTD